MGVNILGSQIFNTSLLDTVLLFNYKKIIAMVYYSR